MIRRINTALKTHKISVRELIAECEKNAKKFESCNMFIGEYFATTLKSAEDYQKLIDGGNAPSLCGIPVAIKDNIAIKDLPLTCGSELLKDYVSPYSATAVEKLRNSGAIIIGKTNMDEFGMGSHSQYSYFGGVKNPIDSAFSPGGSSGGSAAAVKSSAAIIALGSDTGGSIRLPAAFCGVCGLRPTYGAVSRYGLVAFSSSLDTIGTLGNTPADCYETFAAIRGIDTMDATSKEGTAEMPQSLKVCSFLDCFCHETDAVVYKVIKDFLEARKGVVQNITEVSLPEADFTVSAYYLLSSSEAASNLARFDGIRYGGDANKNQSFNSFVSSVRTNGFGDEVKKRIILGNYALCEGSFDQYYRKALSVRKALEEKITALLEDYDAILLPTSLIAVPKLADTESISKNYGNDKCNAIAALCGLPSISFPVGKDANGMPVSLSIIGRKFGERYICDLAERLSGEGGQNV